MTVRVLVKPHAQKDEVVVGTDGSLTVRVRALPVEGAANQAVAEVLADHFNVAKSQVQLMKGGKGRYKIFLVDDGSNSF